MKPQYRVIDVATLARREQFQYFNAMTNPYASLTVSVDITKLLSAIKKRGLPFFLTALYALERGANSVPEFRQRLKDGAVVEYEWCFSSYTVALPDRNYCYCEVDARLPFQAYLKDAKARQLQAMANPSLQDDDPNALFFVSSLPSISFTSLSLPTPSPADGVPRLTLGKYFASDGKVLLPLAIQVNHALIDGQHIAAMLDAFQAETDALVCGAENE